MQLSSDDETLANMEDVNLNQSGQGFVGNTHARDDNIDIGNERQNQQTRVLMEPYDNQLSNNHIFRNPSFTEVSLSVLESDNAVHNTLFFKYINLQIIRFVTSCPTSSANAYPRRTNTTNDGVKFTHLILSKVHSALHPDYNSRLVYIMEARNQNVNLWQKNLNHRDNGEISIGSIIRYSCTIPIETYMRNDIPIIQSPFPVILLKTPSRLYPLCINEEIEGHTSLGFVYNNTELCVTLLFQSTPHLQDFFVTVNE